MVKKTLDNFVNKVLDNLPESVRKGGESVRSGVREGLQAALGKMELVTQTDFEKQKVLLLELQEKVNRLEKQLDKKPKK